MLCSWAFADGGGSSHSASISRLADVGPASAEQEGREHIPLAPAADPRAAPRPARTSTGPSTPKSKEKEVEKAVERTGSVGQPTSSNVAGSSLRVRSQYRQVKPGQIVRFTPA